MLKIILFVFVSTDCNNVEVENNADLSMSVNISYPRDLSVILLICQRNINVKDSNSIAMIEIMDVM